MNPFPYSDDNKRYYTMNYYFKHSFGRKIAKVPLHAGFTCPNRDGTKGYNGCTFCSSKGSGDSILLYESTLPQQYEQGLVRMHNKWPDCLGFAYFQSFTNTYADLETLKRIYDPFYEMENVHGIAIATRPDCLSQNSIEYFAEKAGHKETWIEIGLQSVNDKTMEACNRHHTTAEVWQTLEKLKKTPIKTCLHIINSLPGETQEDMLETARQVAVHHPTAIKIHMLHLIKGTQMAQTYKKQPFKLMSRDEYVDTVIKQLEILPEDMIIERLTGDGLAPELIEPLWTIKKTIVLNEIDKKMARENTWQSKYYKKEE